MIQPRDENSEPVLRASDEPSPITVMWWPAERALRYRRHAIALAKINRLPTILGYNLAYAGIGLALTTGPLRTGDLATASLYLAAVLLAKGQASIADAIHDRRADAANPGKSGIARAVTVVGVRGAWAILAGELVLALALFGAVTLRVGNPLYLGIGAAFALLGLAYSFPPRLKERGLLNHLVTTGTDVCVLVLPLPVLLGGVSPSVLAAAGVVFLYAFAYHLLHQAADAHHDRAAGLETFATRAGVPCVLTCAAGLTAAAAGLAAALGYAVAAGALLAAAVRYACLRSRAVPLLSSERSALLSRRFSIARTATLLNLAMAISAGLPVV
jgi:4-hydroxybenzoate polyprenyltransferase